VTVQLKSWLDAIARARVTFRYTESGPEGLLKNKKVIVALARGGIHVPARIVWTRFCNSGGLFQGGCLTGFMG